MKQATYNVRCLLKINGVLQPGYKTPEEIAEIMNQKDREKKSEKNMMKAF
jgi:hypothetical protein